MPLAAIGSSDEQNGKSTEPSSRLLHISGFPKQHNNCFEHTAFNRLRKICSCKLALKRIQEETGNYPDQALIEIDSRISLLTIDSPQRPSNYVRTLYNSLGGVNEKAIMNENPIGKLQEFCTAHRLSSPQYILIATDGPPHHRLFTVVVQVFNLEETGYGTSKQLAKHHAALLLFHKLKSLRNEEIEQLKAWTQINSRLHINYIYMLQSIASKHEFVVQLYDLQELTGDGLHQCLLRCTTWPLVVTHGTGVTSYIAANDAAMQALDSLQIIVNMPKHINLQLEFIKNRLNA